MIQRRFYDVVTLYDCMHDPATLAWLEYLDLPLPGMPPPGRYPTPVEIKTVLEGIQGIRVSYWISARVWEATMVSRVDVTWGSLAIRDYTGDPESPHHFYYPAGWDEIILLVTSNLVRQCGPLVLLPDSGGFPQLVY